MRGKRQNIQYSLALDLTGRGESPLGGHQGTEPPVAKPDPESPALAEPLLRLNPDEPPWYGPVCPVVWEGRHREVPSSYTPLSRSMTAYVVQEIGAIRQRPTCCDREWI